jgi:hypothetical protein
MKFSNAAVLAAALPAATARFVEGHEVDNVLLYPDSAAQETYLIELSPGETRRVTEEEKWELRRVRIFLGDLHPEPSGGAPPPNRPRKWRKIVVGHDN